MADEFTPYKLTIEEIKWAKDLLEKVAGHSVTGTDMISESKAIRAIAIARESEKRRQASIRP